MKTYSFICIMIAALLSVPAFASKNHGPTANAGAHSQARAAAAAKALAAVENNIEINVQPSENDDLLQTRGLMDDVSADNSGVDVTTVIEDAENPASSAASLALYGCQTGVSGQVFGGGGAIGGEARECRKIRLAVALEATKCYHASRSHLPSCELLLSAMDDVTNAGPINWFTTKLNRYLLRPVIDLIPWLGKAN